MLNRLWRRTWVVLDKAVAAGYKRKVESAFCRECVLAHGSMKTSGEWGGLSGAVIGCNHAHKTMLTPVSPTKGCKDAHFVFKHCCRINAWLSLVINGCCCSKPSQVNQRRVPVCYWQLYHCRVEAAWTLMSLGQSCTGGVWDATTVWLPAPCGFQTCARGIA